METSRDDFVIAIRSAFLNKGTQQRFSLLGLIIFSILFLILGGINFKPINYLKIAIKEIVYRSTFIVSTPENFIKEGYLKVQIHLNLYNINKKNELEVANLRAKDLLNEFLVLENKRLKKIVDDYLIDSESTFAKVLSDKNSPFFKSIIVNKGSKHGINLGSIVIDNEYLVGKIVEVNFTSSRVLLLSDLNSKIPVILEPIGLLSILSGTGEDYGIIQYNKNESIVESDVIVYTSGIGDLFRAGIPVGKITINNSENEDQKIEFFSDFEQLKFVKILSFKKEEN
ncbi:MAG: rod shape-determining protein MreC [Candidatus Pelagibacter sp.]|nr:rod shape-determining protein MreC [Candidatus Pelagibacter sp.]